MKYRLLFLLLLVVGISIKSFAQKYPTIKSQEAKKHLKQTVKVVGTVSEIYHAKSGKVTYLNFGKYPKQHFRIVIFKKNFSKFKIPLESLVGKKIKVLGYIKNYYHQVEIVLNSEKQILKVFKKED